MDDDGSYRPPLTLGDVFRAGASPEIITHQVQLPREFTDATTYTHVTLAFAFDRYTGTWQLHARPLRDIPAPKPESETRDADVRFQNLEID